MGKKSNPALKATCGGQITRIFLENFMTYDSIEIRPGYHLNLIIGPNGTGKSSIVCAVLLGLGGKPKTLGRADHIGSYVKSGCDQSFIEIELHDPNGSNYVIRRQISSNNHSQFFVNGNVATLSKVNEIRKKYNIQIDNLCTFLPQEKVQDFAKLNPQQLLEQTERTVDYGDLVSKHEELKQLQSSAVDNQKQCNTLEEDLENEKQKNARLEDKVQSINEKRSLHKRVELLNQKRAWLCYHEEIIKKKDIEKDLKLTEKNLEEKRKQHEKYSAQLRKIENGIKDLQEKYSKAKREEAGKKAVVEDRQKRFQQKLENYEDLDATLQAKMAEEESKKQDVARYEVVVDKLSNDLRTCDAEIGSEEALKARNAEVTRELNKNHEKESHLIQKKADVEDEELNLRHECRNIESEVRLMEQRRDIRLDHLKRNQPDVYKSVQWLQENRDMFREHVYNPMLLELNVPNPDMAKYVESRIQYRDLITFTCTNADDMNLLIKKLRVEQKLRINVVCSEEDYQTQQTPDIPINNLRQLGFYTYLKDVVTGPEPILRYLCKVYRFQNIPIGDESTKAKADKVPRGINMFYSENHVFVVKYSSYTGDKSMTIKKLNNPTVFSQPTDENHVRRLKDRREEILEKLKAKHIQVKEIDQEINVCKAELEEIRKRKRNLATTLEERNHIVSQLKRAVKQVEDIKQTIRSPADIQEENKRKRESLKREIKRSLDNLKDAHENLDKAVEQRRENEISFRASRFGIDDLTEKRQLCAEEMSRAQEIHNQMMERQRIIDVGCRRLKEAARQLTDGISVGDRGFAKFEEKFAHLKNTVDELEAEIEETQTKADFLQGGNAQVLHEYEKRQSTIAQITAALEKSRSDLEKKKKQFDLKREEWLNPVKELIQKINLNFDKFFSAMGCAGEVELIYGENPDDFDQYGIKIRVKFRDNVPLQELGRYFQSGGERAVATAIYMLSLQELTSVPFRFVDEINQGMDPANERRILELIVRVTSPIDSTQYFFITPKLLPNIDCADTMCVLCIHNGPAAIPASKWDLAKFKRRYEGLVEEDEDSPRMH